MSASRAKTPNPSAPPEQGLDGRRAAGQKAGEQRDDRGRRQHDVEHAAVLQVDDQHRQQERRVEAGRYQGPGVRDHTEGAQSGKPGQGERDDRRRLQQRRADGTALAAVWADAARNGYQGRVR